VKVWRYISFNCASDCVDGQIRPWGKSLAGQRNVSIYFVSRRFGASNVTDLEATIHYLIYSKVYH
jgi:hypothetical protein